ncbi:MAG: amidohydrolase family protein [Pirellulales bacterium]
MNSVCTRRDALGAAAAVAVASVFADAAKCLGREKPANDSSATDARPESQTDARSDATDVKSGYIDAHVHVWTDDTEKYPLAKGFAKDDMKPATFTPEELLAHARPLGVGRIVLIQMSYYGFDNRYMLDAMQAHPGVFSGVAVIDPEDRPAATMRALQKQGVRGFRIVSDGKDAAKWLDGEAMAAMWRTGAEEKLAICHLINPDALPSVDRMCGRFPDTPVVIDHFARVGMKGKIEEKNLANLCRLARHKNTAVKISAFYALGKKKSPYDDLAAMTRRLFDAFGPKRLMWATDCPFQVQDGHTYADSLAFVKDRLDFLSAEDKTWLLRKTAERVFFS